MTLKLAHIDGDCGNFTCGNFTCGNAFDALEVRNGDEIVAKVRLNYGDGSFTAECSEIVSEKLDRIANDMHLIACVTATIMRAFTEDHKCYCDIFLNEDGDSIELDLFDPLTA